MTQDKDINTSNINSYPKKKKIKEDNGKSIISKRGKKKRDPYIPKEVANRMVRRVAFTTGLPTLSGMGVFIISYLLITKGITDVAPAITLATSALCFLFGLIGLSYGMLSASWDKEPGSILGLENIRPNIERMRSAFKAKAPSKDMKEN